jgi:hypothetical protein
MNLMRFEIADVRLQQRNVPLDEVDATFATRLFDITCSAVGEGWAHMVLSSDVRFHLSHFDLQSVLSLFLRHCADA